MKKLVISLIFIFAFSLADMAQQAKCPVMPAGLLCITQEAGNVAAKNVKTVAAQEAEIQTLKDALKTQEVSIAQLKTDNAVNQAKLEAQINSTDVQLADKTGQLIKCEQEVTRDTAWLEFLVKNQRSKQNGVFNVKLGGN